MMLWTDEALLRLKRGYNITATISKPAKPARNIDWGKIALWSLALGGNAVGWWLIIQFTTAAMAAACWL